jgi:sporulation protein YlmC with PRC-barrel domain
MLSTVNDLLGQPLSAVDGPAGSIHSLLFDDVTWTIRYIVVDCGKWLAGRRVLLSPLSVASVDARGGAGVAVTLDKQKLRKSPDIDSDKPVSRQMETRLHEYYGYTPYWSSAAVLEPELPPGGFPPLAATSPGAGGGEHLLREKRDNEGDPHLRSTREVRGYHVQATDGAIGHVDDVIIDHDSWTIWRLIVDTSNWPGGRSVLLSPARVRAIDWNRSKIIVDISRERVRKSPEFHPRDMLAHAPSRSSGNSNDVA